MQESATTRTWHYQKLLDLPLHVAFLYPLP